jgi:hypothetical protein
MVASRIFRMATLAVLVVAGPLAAQQRDANPNRDPVYEHPAYASPSVQEERIESAPSYERVDPGSQEPGYVPPSSEPADQPAPAAPAQESNEGIAQRDVVTAAENVFGKGAKGLAQLIEKIMKDQGEPTAYIAGREASGAFVVGVRYGSGTMNHKIEGQRPVYWTGPSVGFDVGGDANRVFVLVYNLHDSQELFRRFPNAEGHAYFVGGFSASMLRRGDVVLIPIRLGVGMRLGVNAGYMSFSEKSRWLPF